MSTYQNTLPMVFSYWALWNKDDVQRAVDMLLREDYSIPAGSSFAVTSDTYMYGGTKNDRRLWLSEVSYRRILDSGDFVLCTDVVSLRRREDEDW